MSRCRHHSGVTFDRRGSLQRSGRWPVSHTPTRPGPPGPGRSTDSTKLRKATHAVAGRIRAARTDVVEVVASVVAG